MTVTVMIVCVLSLPIPRTCRHHHQFILPYFQVKLQIYIMKWQVTRQTQSSTSWRPIINGTAVNILLQINIQWNKKERKLTDREQDRNADTFTDHCCISCNN